MKTILLKAKRRLLILMAALSLMMSSSAMAITCDYLYSTLAERDIWVFYGQNMIVQQNAPAGTVIFETWTNQFGGGRGFLGCRTAWTLAMELDMFPTLSSYGNKVYNTNIPGIGLRLSVMQGGEIFPATRAMGADVYAVIAGLGVGVQLIKTTAGATGTGLITSGRIAGFRIKESPTYFASLSTYSGGRVVAGSCTVNATTVNVKLEQATTTNFTGIGSTAKPKTFNIALNCNSGTKVKLTLDGKRAGPAGVLGLNTGSGQASGIGIQLLKGTSVIALGSKLDYGTSGSGTTQLPVIARYYQTAATIVPGTTSASATFTVEYN